MFIVFPIMPCLDLRAWMESEGKGAYRKGQFRVSCSRRPGGSSLGSLWPPGLLRWLERRKVGRGLLISEGSSLWGSGHQKSREHCIIPHHLLSTQRDQLLAIGAFYADSKKKKKKKEKRREKKKPTYKNKNPLLLISCQHNQKSPFLLSPLKSPGVLIMLAQSGKTMVGFCRREAYPCSCKGGIQYFNVRMETSAENSPKPAPF